MTINYNGHDLSVTGEPSGGIWPSFFCVRRKIKISYIMPPLFNLVQRLYKGYAFILRGLAASYARKDSNSSKVSNILL
jgi:hypothetical protein